MEPFSPAASAPPAAGFVPLKAWKRTAVATWLDLEIDRRTGALIHLVHTGSPASASWASASHPIALLQYQTLVEADLIKWREGFLQPWTLTADMAKDYGKPGMNTSDLNVKHQLEAPNVLSAWVQQSGADTPQEQQQFLIEVEFAAELHSSYGAPARAWINYTVGSAATQTVALEISLLNKTATRCASHLYQILTEASSTDLHSLTGLTFCCNTQCLRLCS